MKSKLNLECLSERITPSAGVDNPGTVGYSVPTPPAQPVPPPDVLPTRQETLDQSNKLIDEMNDLSDTAKSLMIELLINERNQRIADKQSENPDLSAADRAAAKKESEMLKKQHGELVDKLKDAVDAYKRLERELMRVNLFTRYDIETKELNELPDGYGKYVPPVDPRTIS